MVFLETIIVVSRLLYDAAHLMAFLLELTLELTIWQLEKMGPAAWVLSVLWLVLVLLDGTGRVNLHSELAKLLAAFVLPAVGGIGEILIYQGYFWGDRSRSYPPEVYSCIVLLSLLLLYVLIRRDRAREQTALEQVEELLQFGSELSISMAAWLLLLGGIVALITTVGILFTVLLGELMSSQYSLFDYGGLAGVLMGLLLLYLVQIMMFWRGLRLIKQEYPDLVVPHFYLLLYLPIGNLIWAGRLRRRLRTQQAKEGGHPSWAES